MKSRTLSLGALALAGGAVAASPGVWGLDHRISNDHAFIDKVDGDGELYALERVFPGLAFDTPVYLTNARDGTERLYVVERAGSVHRLDPVADPARDRPATRRVLDLRSRVQSQLGNELGLLSIAFAPDFATSRRVYAFYSTGQRFSPVLAPGTVRNRVSRFLADSAADFTIDPATEEVLLEIPKNYFNHNGGQLQFGPDGMLYVSTGDGGSEGDVERNGQNLKTLKSKILRIDVAPRSGYRVPPDNPFVNVPHAKRETWAYGLRNPWRFSFDRVSGALWAGDVGQDEWEEVDVVEKGGNYGWSRLEGDHVYDAAVPATHPLAPVHEYSHASAGSCVIGGYVYRGSRLPGLAGAYVHGDYTTGNVWALRRHAGVVKNERLFTAGSLDLTSFGEDEKGELYLCSYDGPLYRIVPTTSTSRFPKKLSETGLFSDVARLRMDPALLPYHPVEPFWSDGAKKERWIAIPHLEQVVRTEENGWKFPEGSVLVKHFLLEGKPVETRLMVHAKGRWTGYSYEWNDLGTDGDLLEAGKKKTIAGHVWTFPSRADCFRCHEESSGTLLGVQTLELDSELDYSIVGGRVANQLETLAHLGVFTRPLPAQGTIEHLVNHEDARASLGARARSYLHVNCSMCHRPGGAAAANIDLRFETKLADTKIVGAVPQDGDLGVHGARIVEPGDPGRSVLYLRMHRRGAGQMPPLATHVVDEEGAKVLAEWIRSLRH